MTMLADTGFRGRIRARVFPHVAMLCTLVAMPAAAQSGGAVPPMDAPVLRPGDSLRLAVWKNQEMSGSFVVAGDGSIAHPRYQAVVVAGVPLTEVRDRIQAFLARERLNPEVLVQPLFRVIVTGQVRLPNVFVLPPEATIADAIGAAGGPTETGNLGSVRVQRNGREFVVNLNDPHLSGEAMTIRSGDRITVPKRTNVLGVLGPLASLTAIAASIVVLSRH